MATKENNSVWVVCSENGVRLYSCEKYAREEYLREVAYYKNHQPNESDKREYRVWQEVDNDMHYSIVEVLFNGAKRNMTIYYTERIIIK